ncbi:hypothetical protein IQ268_26875 [Oculatella sp. LEGE 06141]|uniref:hypothetical protein n=1 Tax=Oculatella sp. LEGE 06141 TaxID=1828648 RepID=UPI00187F002B|nr:hypothetical protein [Oculatella sp. LEGE 06141]MBE9182195.1 hypothetical protein [Oculatella sp. LEGE 06141]
MTQASSQWQHWINSIQHGRLPMTTTSIAQRLKRLKNSRQLMLSLAFLVVLLWNWKLVLASGVGIFAAIAAYFIQQGDWRFFGVNWDKLWNQVNRQLMVAVSSGGLAALSTYIAIAVWTETDAHGLAAAILLQGLGILAILLLVWQQRTSPVDVASDDYYPMLNALTDSDPLKRLIAIRQITDRLTVEQASVLSATTASSRFNQASFQRHYSEHQRVRSHVVDCFRLMIDRETEPTVCNALLDGLHRLSPKRQLGRGQQPALSIAAASLKQPAIKLRRQTVKDESLLH